MIRPYIIFFILIITASIVYAEQQLASGPIFKFENNLLKHKEKLNNLIKSAIKQDKIIDINSISNIKINSEFAKSIVLASEPKFLSLIKNKCAFYSFIENNLLRTALGPINNILISYNNKSYYINKKIIISALKKTSCINNREISLLFKSSNFDTTVKSINFKIPKKNSDCLNIMQHWKTNPYFPYLCGLTTSITNMSSYTSKLQSQNSKSNKTFYAEQIRKADKVKIKLTDFQLNYIMNTCNYIDNPNKFCSKYVSKDIWKKVITGEYPKYMLKYKCESYLKRDNLTLSDLKRCRQSFIKNNYLCGKIAKNDLIKIEPTSSCSQLSNLLKNTHLKSDYQDCPAKIDNEGILNTHRIIMHFKPTQSMSTMSTCYNETNLSFANINFQYQNNKAWPLKICFINKITESNECKLYIPGHNPKSPISEANVVASIVEQVFSTPSKISCSFVEKDKYNPLKLQYKSGCFLIYDANQCTTLSCPKKIIYNKKELKNISYKGTPLFDYFPNSYKNEKYSISNILNETLKLTSNPIKNFTELKYFIETYKNGIVHGIACIEDILPFFFKRSVLNQCRPTPFIIDGVVRKNNEYKLGVRTTVDDVHSPRLIDWSYIFTGIKNYSQLHPLKSWNLYGIKESRSLSSGNNSNNRKKTRRKN